MVLGIAVILVPLVVFAQFRHETFAPLSPWLNDNIRGLEGESGLRTPSTDISDLTILGVSFVISMIVYLFIRHRIPRPEVPWVRIPPY